MADETEYEEAFNKGLAAARPKIVNGKEYALLPAGCSLESLEHFQINPDRIKQIQEFTEIMSFYRYFNAFKNTDSIIIASIEEPQILAVIDYHSILTPRWCSHRISFKPKLSKSWKFWFGNNDRKFLQNEFLEFLEDNIESIREPAGADIMELCAELEGVKSVNFKSGFKQKDGSVSIRWEENFEEKGTKSGNVKIPNQLKLILSPFENGSSYEVEAWLRYRIKDSKLVFFYKMVQPEKILEDAFSDCIEDVKKNTGITPYLGSVQFRTR